MAIKELHDEYTCDYCGKKEVSKFYPSIWNKIYLVNEMKLNSEACRNCRSRTGHFSSDRFDVCDGCYPKFSVKKEDRLLRVKVFNKIFNYFLNKQKEGEKNG